MGVVAIPLYICALDIQHDVKNYGRIIEQQHLTGKGEAANREPKWIDAAEREQWIQDHLLVAALKSISFPTGAVLLSRALSNLLRVIALISSRDTRAFTAAV